MKNRFNQGLLSNLYFWRDSQGHEIDVLIENGDDLIPVEIKSGQTITADYFTGLQYWKTLANITSWLIYAGKEKQERHGIHVLGWEDIDQINV